MLKRFFAALLTVAVLILTIGCSDVSNLFLFAVTELSFYGGNTKAAEREILTYLETLERSVSTAAEDSDTVRVNRAKAGEPVSVSEEFCRLFELSKQIYTETDGAFDPAIFPAVRLWGFAPGQESLKEPPKQEEIAALLPLLDFSLFTLTDGKVTKSADGAMLDFGGIAKGYALVKIREILQKHGVTGGKADIGGNLYFHGRHREDRPFKVGVVAPEREDGYLMILNLEDSAIATSSGSERYFMFEGKRYCHILDKTTGSPATSELLSVTVLSQNGTLTDAYSTAVFVMGLEKGVRFLEERKVSAVLTFEKEGQKRYYVTGELDYYDVNEEYIWTDLSA